MNEHNHSRLGAGLARR